MKIKAIIFGAAGMVGEGVLLKALNDERVESIASISRKPCKRSHSKLKEIIHNNFYDYAEIENQLQEYDDCFFCLGISSVGTSEQDYTKVTYDLTMAAAKTLSHLNPDMIFCYVSGTGTDRTEHSRMMWARVKGRTERSYSFPLKQSIVSDLDL
jgi:hypothetical protein